MSIPANQVVAVTPSVIGAGGAGLDLNTLCLSNSGRVPTGVVLSFPTAAAVGTYFGPTSPEAAFASIYFGGFDTSTIKPGAILFAGYPTADAGAFLRGGSVAGLTLSQLQALSGVLSLTVNGALTTSAAINFSAAGSFSAAAALIQAGFTSPSFAVSYDSVSGAFVIQDTVTGTTSTISFATGTLSTALRLTSATGAVISQGAGAAVPAAYLSAISQVATNWAALATTFDPDVVSGGNSLKLAFSAWVSQQNNRYVYVCWDGDITASISTTATTSLGYLLKQSAQSGTVMVWGQDYSKAAFICGYIASIDFTRANGRSTAAFKAQAGLTPDVTSATAAANLIANGYNFYGAYATANDNFIYLFPGSVSGKFVWLDSYTNQIWLNNAFQLALMSLLTTVDSLPYNSVGYGLIRAACMDPINAGLAFGAFRAGVPLSAAQAAEVNFAANAAIATTLSTQGWYLSIQPASAQVRGQRKSPPILFMYMDGGSVQQINLASIEVA